jgi:DNA-binding response OmpR family regulator
VKSRTILIVEDDAAVRRAVVDALNFHGFATLEAADAPAGLEMARLGNWDLLLLDLVLPGGDGFSVLREVRRRHPTTPVIVLTARGEESDRVRGLRAGADDYVVKPFSVSELLARVEAVLRRSPERPASVCEVTFASGVIDLARCEVRFADGERTALSQREVELLEYLARHRGRAISRDELLQRLWRVEPSRVESRTVDMHVARLREKLRDTAARPLVLLTVRGKGYTLALGADEAAS